MSNIPDLPNQKEYKDLTPFDLVLIQKFPFLEEDFDSINLYGILNKIKEHLNNLIKNEQIVTENQQNVYNSFKGLHDFVNDYFDNLDVQEEINNKLDEMVESGDFQRIIFNSLQYITYEMFGAKLDGITDDTQAVIDCHNYANEHNLKVVQKRGTLYMPSASLNNCPIINTDCDFSGLKMKFDNNNDGKTVFIIAEPSTIYNRNDIQQIQLTQNNIAELYKNNTDRIDFLENYKNCHIIFNTDMLVGKRTLGNLEEIFYSQSFITNDLAQLSPNNMYADMSNASNIIMRYLSINQQKIEINLGEINIDGNVNSNPEFLIMRNNTTLKNANITKSNYNNTTEWTVPLFNFKYCYNSTVENFTGNAPQNEPIGENITAYVIAFNRCYATNFNNNKLHKGHGSFVSYFTNFMNFNDNNINRFDNHYGLFGNININNCNFISYPAGVNLGFGNATVNINNCEFYKYKENGKNFAQDCITCRTDLTVMFSGILNVKNVTVNAKADESGSYVTLLQYIPSNNENSVFPDFGEYKTPIINIDDLNFITKNVSARTLRIYNNNSDFKNYILQSIKINKNQKTNVNSIFSIAGYTQSSNSCIKLNNENAQIIANEKSFIFDLENYNTINSSVNNTNLTLNSYGHNNNVSGNIKTLNNYGNISISDCEIENCNNYASLNCGNNNAISNIRSIGSITGTPVITNGNVSGRINIDALTVITELVITGAIVNIYNSITNNGIIYLAGNYMNSTVAGKFNNGTINGNGNWGGTNSSVINTLS